MSLFTNDDLSSFSEADGLVRDVDLVAVDVPEIVEEQDMGPYLWWL